MKVFLTGRPGSGKSTVFAGAVTLLGERGLRVRGIATPEVRGARGSRVGFDVADLSGGARGALARVPAESRLGAARAPRVGRYLVDVEAFEAVARPALEATDADVVAVDEVGKMEHLSPWFAEVWAGLLASETDVLAVVGRAYLRECAGRGTVLAVTDENRSHLAEETAALFGA